jgi:glucokinase
MYLGIEIGGTKLQLGVGAGDGELIAVERFDVQAKLGAAAILDQIEKAGRVLIALYKPSAVGIGFGGPVDSRAGVVIKSHHVDGWQNFPLVEWCRRTRGRPAVL